jgi:hypothetical protein
MQGAFYAPKKGGPLALLFFYILLEKEKGGHTGPPLQVFGYWLFVFG